MTTSDVRPPAEAGEEAEAEALDAYSRVVTRVAEALLPSVASLRVGTGGWAKGSGSAVAISDDGFLVTSVVAGSPAARAGIRPEDLILTIDGVAVTAIGELQRLLSAERIGKPVRIALVRNGQAVET